MEEQFFKKFNFRKFFLVAIAVSVLIAFGAMLNQTPWADFSIRDTQGTVGYEEDSWVLRHGDTVLDSQVHLPDFFQLDYHELYSVSTQLTYDGNQDEMPYAFIHLDHMYCRVFLDDQELFSCMPEDVQKWDNSRSPGFIYKAFPLPHDCLGKEFKIQVLPPMETSMEYGLPEITFGDFPSTLRATIVRDTPHNIITILCTFLGMAAILFSAAILRGSDYREGISIGVFSLLFALYLITECRINTYYIENPYYLYLLNYIPFSLLPVSLMGFMRERLPEKHRKLCTAFIVGEILFFLLEMFLHFSGILDMRQIIPVIHLIYFSEMILVTILILTMKEKSRKYSLVSQITPVVIGMLADALIYWLHWEIGINDATFTILGVILLLIIELLHIWKSSISMYTESVRSNLYRQMAFIDELTGVSNRRSYDQEIDRIISREQTYSSMLVASADVNRLKYVNDHFGHAAGDNLIRSAAQILSEAIGSNGKVFRTGGDEFAMFLYDTSLPQYEEMLKAANSQIADFNLEHEYPLSLAIGCVQIRDDKILEAVHEADRKMYANKATFKMSSDHHTDRLFQKI